MNYQFLFSFFSSNKGKSMWYSNNFFFNILVMLQPVCCSNAYLFSLVSPLLFNNSFFRTFVIELCCSQLCSWHIFMENGCHFVSQLRTEHMILLMYNYEHKFSSLLHYIFNLLFNLKGGGHTSLSCMFLYNYYFLSMFAFVCSQTMQMPYWFYACT